MSLIGLIGPNAIGKTTAVRRWCARYRNLVGCLCDEGGQGVDLEDGKETLRVGWKGDVARKGELVALRRACDKVCVLDSARNDCARCLLPGETIIVVTCSWEMSRDNIVTRCILKGKKFNDEYWTEQKLRYESSERYLNFVSKWRLDHVHFKIADKARDWPRVDDYFGQLFRRLHNERRGR